MSSFVKDMMEYQKYTDDTGAIDYMKYIKDAKIDSGADVLKLCLRNFPIGSEIKYMPLSTPIPEYLRVDSEYEEKYYKCAAERNRVYKMTFEDARSALAENFAKVKADAKELLAEYRQCETNLHKIVKEIEEWVPPTPEHAKVKEFALSKIDLDKYKDACTQLEKIIDTEVDLSDEAVKLYFEKMKHIADQNLKQAQYLLQDRKEHVEKMNLFMRQFLESLDSIEHDDTDKDIER